MGELELQSFGSLKRAISQAPVIAHFNPGFETIIQTDASLFGWGFVISQVNSTTGLEHPVAIESGSFLPAELNYTVTEKEFLAIVHAILAKTASTPSSLFDHPHRSSQSDLLDGAAGAEW